MAAYGTFIIYQLCFLLPISLLTTVNLNYVLCHSPYDPFHTFFGDHYIPGGVLLLNIFSFFARYINYIIVLPLKLYFDWKDREGKSKNGYDKVL
jgi:hypothetical protein